jgi:L-lactate dehydrogenase complex protein LldF
LTFRERAAAVLARDATRELGVVCDAVSRMRVEQLGGYPEPEILRRRARAIRENALAHLGDLAAQFAERAAESGARVHFAGDAAEARAMVVEIARASRCASVVKMKSMLSEELRIRPALTSAGLTTLETDLGEWILQLAEERPAHMLMPAIHKSRHEVKALFDAEMGIGSETEAAPLVRRARAWMRRAFIQADLGVTGVNFAIAESGTLVIVENEGNGRLSMSSPSIHIALVPVEKLVPTHEQMVTLLRLLVASASGQKAPRYVSLVRGPRGVAEIDGPRELHVILVDNGRIAALGTELEDALMCLRCGACLNICPVFKSTGGQTYPGTYSGPIGVAMTEILESGTADEIAHASSLCQACRDACPVRIDLPRLIHAVRERATAAGRVTPNRRERLARFASACLDREKYAAELAEGSWLGLRTETSRRNASEPFRQQLARRSGRS